MVEDRAAEDERNAVVAKVEGASGDDAIAEGAGRISLGEGRPYGCLG